MRNRSIFRLLPFALFVLALVLNACRNQAPKDDSNLTGYEKNRTAHDTAQVVGLLNQFFGYLEEDHVTDAVAMLYVLNDSDIYAEPQLLDNEQIPAVTRRFKSMPIVGHRIDYIKFYEAYLNEAKVTAVIAEAGDGQPELKTHYYFRLYDYLGAWRLCLMNSDRGDLPIVPLDKADSLTEKFNREVSERQPAEE